MSGEHQDESTKSPSGIEADIAASQQRLADNVDQLIDRASPKAVVGRGVESGKERLHEELYDANGELRTNRILTVAGAGVGVIAALVALRLLLAKKRG